MDGNYVSIIRNILVDNLRIFEMRLPHKHVAFSINTVLR